MIKKLRFKFILIAMLSITLVLSVVMATINAINYGNINSYADSTLQIIADNGGNLPSPDGTTPPEIPEEDRREGDRRHGGDSEGFFESRFYTVLFNNDGTVTANVKNIALIDEQEAKSIATELKSKGTSSGFYGNYKYISSETSDGTLYIFLDCTNRLETFRSFLKWSILISVASLIVVFVLVYFSSAIVFKPVAETYAKQK